MGAKVDIFEVEGHLLCVELLELLAVSLWQTG